uniref:Uncharacterized protein n=1 Tax=Romanomermis culicivorax TaxID=13658 RepID=A0A915KLN6_ROMCU
MLSFQIDNFVADGHNKLNMSVDDKQAPQYFILYEPPNDFFDWPFEKQKADLMKRLLNNYKKAAFVDEDKDQVILDDDDSFVEAIKVISREGRLSCRVYSPIANPVVHQPATLKPTGNRSQDHLRKALKKQKEHALCLKNCDSCGHPAQRFVCLKKKCNMLSLCADCTIRHATDHPMLRFPDNAIMDLKKVANGVEEVLKAAVKEKKKLNFKLLSKSSNFKNDQLIISWKLKNRGHHSESGLKIKFIESILEPIRSAIILPKIAAKTVIVVETILRLDKKRLIDENKKLNIADGKAYFIESKWALFDDRNGAEDILLNLRDSTPVMLLMVDAKEKIEAPMPEPECVLHHNEAPTAHIVAKCSEEHVSHYCHIITDKPVICHDSIQLIKEDDEMKMNENEQIIKEFSLLPHSNSVHSSLGNDSLISVKSTDENISSSIGFEDADNRLDDKDFVDMYQSALIDNDLNSDSTTRRADFDDFSVHSHVSNEDSDVEILNVSNENTQNAQVNENVNGNIHASSELVNKYENESNAEIPIIMANESPSMMANLNQVLDNMSCGNTSQEASIAQESLENDSPSRENGHVLNFESGNVFEQQIREEAPYNPRSSQLFENGNAKLTEFLSKVLRSTSHAFENVSVASSQAFAAVNDALEAIQSATRPPETPLPRPFVPPRTNPQQPQMAEIAADVLLHQAWVPKSTQTTNIGADVKEEKKKSMEETLSRNEKDLCDFVRKSRTLKELGFNDDARNAQLLIQYNGDLNHVIDDLLESSSASVFGITNEKKCQPGCSLWSLNETKENPDAEYPELVELTRCGSLSDFSAVSWYVIRKIAVENRLTSKISHCKWNPHHSSNIIAAAVDCNVKGYDIRTDAKVWSVRFNPVHDQLLLSCSSDARLILHSTTSISSESILDVSENKSDNEDDSIESSKSKKDPEILGDGIIKIYEEHEDSVYCCEWSITDPWLFASLSYDGRVIINKVLRNACPQYSETQNGDSQKSESQYSE